MEKYTYSLDSVKFKQDKDHPYILSITADDINGYEIKIGSFNFWEGEGYVRPLGDNGKRKEYKQWKSLMNNFFKWDDRFSWSPKDIDAAQKSGREKRKLK